jgi:hypothetical protein
VCRRHKRRQKKERIAIAIVNREIELHDTRIQRIELVGSSIVLWLSAYMHESKGRPGLDRGTGWSLPARLVVENGKFDRPFSSPSLCVADGHVSVGDRRFDNCIPMPFDERGKIRLFLSGGEGELVISGDRTYLEPTGPAVCIEEFSGSDEI